MADELETTPIQNAYAQQFANDLAINHKEQEEVTRQIAALQQRLEQLRADAAWLAQAQDSLTTVFARSPSVAKATPGTTEAPSATPAEQTEASTPAEAATHTPQTVPQPRQDQSEKAARAKQPAKKAAANKKTTTKKTVAKKAAAELVPPPRALRVVPQMVGGVAAPGAERIPARLRRGSCGSL
ncbi:hypothetical protein AB0G64_35830, partial [Streptomyces longwoodensis]